MANATACNYSTEVEPTAAVDAYGRTTYTLGYKVVTDGVMAPGAVANDVVAAGTDPGPITLPNMGSTYSFQGFTDSYSYLLDRQVTPLDWYSDKTLYQIVDTYQPPPDGDLAQYSTNPVGRYPVFEFDREVYAATVEFDNQGNQIVNTAGQPYDEPVEMEHTRSVLVASYNVATLATAVQLITTYEGAVNSQVWYPGGGTTAIQPRQALCREVTSSRLVSENGSQYYRLTFRVAIHEPKPATSPYAQAGTWDLGLLQRGFIAYRSLRSGGKDPLNVKGYIRTDGSVEGDDFDSTAERSNEPFLLADDGTVLPADQDGRYQFYRVRREVSFANIGF